MTDAKRTSTRRRLAAVAVAGLLTATLASTSGSAAGNVGFGPAAPVPNVNSDGPDGCPIESPDGRSLFLASTRTRVEGAVDQNIWVARRSNEKEPWGTPEPLADPVNTLSNDICPTPLHGKRLLFVSDRSGGCNTVPGGDIYLTRLHPVHGPDDPQNLGCVKETQGIRPGPNFDGPEFSPSLVTTDAGTWLFYSSTGDDTRRHLGDQDLYVSEQRADGSFGPPAKINELSTESDDQMPNVSPNGLEMVFVSNRLAPVGQGGALDVYISRRDHVHDEWKPAEILGPNVNTTAAESRPSLSADGERLYFGRSGDIWMSIREHGD